MKVKRPMIEFCLSFFGGAISMAFSSNLTGYTQTFFVGNLLVENSFVLSIVVLLVAGLLYEKPDGHFVYGLTLIVLAINQFIIQSSLSPIPVTALGPVGAGLTLVGGSLGVMFRPIPKTTVAEESRDSRSG